MTRKRRPIYDLIVALYAREPLTKTEKRRLLDHDREYWRQLDELVPDAQPGESRRERKARWGTLLTGDTFETYRAEVLEDIDSPDSAVLRARVKELLFLLGMADDLRAELEGERRRERRQHQNAQSGSVRAKQETLAQIRTRIEALRKKNPTLSKKAVARIYLHDLGKTWDDDQVWDDLTQSRQEILLESLLHRLRPKKKTGR